MEDFLKVVLKYTSDLVFVTDHNGKLTYANRAWLEELGYRQDIINTLHTRDFIHPDYYHLYEKKNQTPDQEIKPAQIEIPFVKSNGRILIAEGFFIHDSTKDGGNKYLGLFKNISEQKLTEEKSLLYEQRYKAVFEQDYLGMLTVDVFGKITQANRRMSEILEYNISELESKNILEFTHPDDREATIKINRDLLNLSKTRSNRELRLITATGKIRYGNESIQVVLDAKNNPDYFLVFFDDFTEKKIAQEKLTEQSAKLRAIFNSSSQAMVTINSRLVITAFNQNFANAFEKITGKYPVANKTMADVFTKMMDESQKRYFLSLHNEALQGGKKRFEHKIHLWNNTHVWVDGYLDPIIIPGRKTEEISYIIHDITEKKNIEEDIRKSLLEKEILLKEVHHRVKNNLQVIYSILNLQTQYMDDEKAIEILREIQNRISSMALIHEYLYQHNDISALNTGEYIRMLVNNLSQSATLQKGTTEIEFDLEDLMLDLDYSIPCGLIINEMVSNAFKHAFSSVENPKLQISFRKEKDFITLKVGDNGKGFPGHINYKDTNSLGMQLIMALTNQLDGEISMQPNEDAGTLFTIRFHHHKK
ncbi:MAG: PAS domain S-box protein [Bacteroidota bacterium]|jgi:PAS domain S-box-containing protein